MCIRDSQPPPDSLVIFANWWDNPYFPEVLRKSMEHMKESNYEKYLNIWCGELKKLAEGAIFGRQIAQVEKEGRRTYIPIEKNVEIFTFGDLGRNDESAFWFLQRAGLQNRMVDYFEGRLEEVEYYVRFMKFMPYNYGRHYLPHDAEHKRLGMKNKSLEDQFNDAGIRPSTIIERIPEKSLAHELAREVMAKTWFHKGEDLNVAIEDADGYYPHTENEDMMSRTRRCERGFEALCNYRYKYKEEDDVYHQTPHHDWASNGADAFMQYGQSDFHTKGHRQDEYSDWSKPING